jgi:protein-S-isoprenylcysteine O-methyltransferase Ste14
VAARLAAVVVLLVVRIVSAVVVYRVNPALLRERARLPIHGDQPWSDKVLLLLVITTGFVGLPVVAGCDVFRWHVLPPPGTLVSALGLVLFVLGWVIKGMALRANAFATSVVRLQHERKHAVADTVRSTRSFATRFTPRRRWSRGSESVAGIVHARRW